MTIRIALKAEINIGAVSENNTRLELSKAEHKTLNAMVTVHMDNLEQEMQKYINLTRNNADKGTTLPGR